ncbi:MAG: sigma factor-like helix-turn-helix DNA-binding protein [Planctomycetota bacterium]
MEAQVEQVDQANELTAKDVRKAADGKPAAVAKLAGRFYPAVVRMSLGLTGRDDLGPTVARTILRRSVTAMRNWRDEHAPERWYRHHTVLEVRHALAHNIGTRRDVLLPPDADTKATAFLAAVRRLPHQQREAFLLHHAEKLGPRTLAVSMDCSVEAAGNHLHAADKSLRLITDDFETHVDVIARQWQALTPPVPEQARIVVRQTRRALLPRRIKRVCQWILFYAFLVALAGATWWVVENVEW